MCKRGNLDFDWLIKCQSRLLAWFIDSLQQQIYNTYIQHSLQHIYRDTKTKTNCNSLIHESMRQHTDRLVTSMRQYADLQMKSMRQYAERLVARMRQYADRPMTHTRHPAVFTICIMHSKRWIHAVSDWN